MNCTTKTARTTLLALLAITLIAGLGCNPAAKENVAKPDEADKPKSPATASAGSSTTTSIAAKANDNTSASKLGEPGVITGELNEVDWNSMLDKEVTVAGDLVVIDTHDLARRGQIKLARKRLYVPTSEIDPNDADAAATSFEGGSNVAKVVSMQEFNGNATVTLDDGSDQQNVFPLALFPELGKSQPTVRVGSVLHGVTGTLMKERRNIVLVPDGPLKWTPAPRPQRPDVGKASVTVASFNVLNYFTTLDDGENRARGADSESEFKRQEEKIVSAILALDAGVIGLMELENNRAAEVQLVAALNRKLGKDVFRGCGLPKDFSSVPGGQDAIRVGIIYRSDRVDVVGDVSTIRDEAFEIARAPIVQAFQAKNGGKRFSVVVNHFKSKGGARNAEPGNQNKGDGQGAFNAARRSQSLAICDFIDQLKENGKEARVLVIGDLNAYQQEDPIDALRARGLVDLHHKFHSGSAVDQQQDYSFIFRGQSGSLDHAMATKPLAKDITGIATWHINADEPRCLDYNEEFNPKSLYEANPFRSSDHDPVLIGIGH